MYILLIFFRPVVDWQEASAIDPKSMRGNRFTINAEQSKSDPGPGFNQIRFLSNHRHLRINNRFPCSNFYNPTHSYYLKFTAFFPFSKS
jgi:hypothetical protein